MSEELRAEIEREVSGRPSPILRSRTVTSHPWRSADGLPGVVALFRMKDERAREVQGLRAARG